MVVSTKIVKNEQHRLAATFFNNIAIGCVLLGLIGPLATGRYSHFLTLEFVYSEGAAWVLAAVLHMIARRQLSLLEEVSRAMRDDALAILRDRYYLGGLVLFRLPV